MRPMSAIPTSIRLCRKAVIHPVLEPRPVCAAGLIVAFMQFWADLGSPPHLVVVGKPLMNMDEHFQTRT